MHLITSVYGLHPTEHSFRILLCEQCRSCCCPWYVHMRYVPEQIYQEILTGITQHICATESTV